MTLKLFETHIFGTVSLKILVSFPCALWREMVTKTGTFWSYPLFENAVRLNCLLSTFTTENWLSIITTENWLSIITTENWFVSYHKRNWFVYYQDRKSSCFQDEIELPTHCVVCSAYWSDIFPKLFSTKHLVHKGCRIVSGVEVFWCWMKKPSRRRSILFSSIGLSLCHRETIGLSLCHRENQWRCQVLLIHLMF